MFESIDLSEDPVITIVSRYPISLSRSLQSIDLDLRCILPSDIDTIFSREPDMLIVVDVDLSVEEKEQTIECLGKCTTENLFTICLSDDMQDSSLSAYVDSICYLPTGHEIEESINRIANCLVEAVSLKGLGSCDLDDMHYAFQGAGNTYFQQTLAKGENRVEIAMSALNPIGNPKSVVIVTKSGPDITMDEYEHIIQRLRSRLPDECELTVMAKIGIEFTNGEILVSGFFNGMVKC